MATILKPLWAVSMLSTGVSDDDSLKINASSNNTRSTRCIRIIYAYYIIECFNVENTKRARFLFFPITHIISFENILELRLSQVFYFNWVVHPGKFAMLLVPKPILCAVGTKVRFPELVSQLASLWCTYFHVLWCAQRVFDLVRECGRVKGPTYHAHNRPLCTYKQVMGSIVKHVVYPSVNNHYCHVCSNYRTNGSAKLESIIVTVAVFSLVKLEMGGNIFFALNVFQSWILFNGLFNHFVIYNVL